MPPRQEVLNVLIAELLGQRGMIAVPEQIIEAKRGRRMPDVVVDFQGLRLVIEGEFDTGPEKRVKAIGSAWKRVEEGLAHVGIGMLYPEALRRESLNLDELRDRLASVPLQFAIITEEDERQEQLSIFGEAEVVTDADYTQGTVDHLAEALRRAYDEIVGEGVVTRAVETLETAIGAFAGALRPNDATSGRLAGTLGMKAE